MDLEHPALDGGDGGRRNLAVADFHDLVFDFHHAARLRAERLSRVAVDRARTARLSNRFPGQSRGLFFIHRENSSCTSQKRIAACHDCGVKPDRLGPNHATTLTSWTPATSWRGVCFPAWWDV